MKPSSFYDRLIDVMEALVKFILPTRDTAAYLTNRFSEPKEFAKQLEGARHLKSI